MDSNTSSHQLLQSLFPMTKGIFALCISLSVFFVPGYIYSLSCFGLLILLSIISGLGKKFIGMLSKTIFIVVILMFIMQALFYPGEHIIWQWKAIAIKQEGLMYALVLSSKLLVIGGSIILFFLSTKVKDFVCALEQWGASKTLSYIILSTFQIIPQMEKRSKVIMDAQRSRGVETEGSIFNRAKAFVPSIGPLILSSIVGTEERAITLEARAFSAPVDKVRLHEVHDTKKDQWLRYMTIAVCIAIIVGRVITWIW